MEEILINKFRTGTTIHYFNTKLSTENVDLNPAYVIFNNFGEPISLNTFDGTSLWSRDGNNNFIPLQYVTTNYVTGQTFFNQSDYSLSNNERIKLKEKFEGSMDRLFSGQSSSYVFFEEKLVNDLFATVSLNRTYGTLDTLNVYNELINGIPEKEASTGVVFGKLEAIQKIEDRQGDKIRIPLRNVPIGVFLPSEEFAASTSVDDNGDRLILNHRETKKESDYYDFYSFSADTTLYLRAISGVTEIPLHYKHITYTNDNGEFVLYDIPVGSQTVVFEIDLLNQGLTRDEVALNRFPYPGDIEANIDTIPHFFFQQVPIDVVPAWGPNQSGYTELNIAVNLDLRKWTTYYISPISFEGKSMNELLAGEGITTPMRYYIRDMSRPFYPTSNISVVEVHDMLDRDRTQNLEWRNELVQLKNAAEFRDHDFHAFKLPANIYDPIGVNSKEVIKKNKDINYDIKLGLWLSCYQFKFGYLNKSYYRATGYERIYNGTGYVTRNHFDINRGDLNTNAQNSDVINSRSGNFPYQQVWDHLYPAPYSIPSIPSSLNTSKPIISNGTYGGDDRIPKYTDGDLVGFFPSTLKSGGYGLQFYSLTSRYQSNRFSKRVTDGLVYKYENDVWFGEKYSNGYESNNLNFTVQPGISKVLNGEKYQRVESGYAYWLRPEGWSNIKHIKPDHDAINPQDMPPTNTNTFFVDPQDLTLDVDASAPIQEGGLDIYRIVNPNSIVDPDPEINPTFINLDFPLYRRKGNPDNILRAAVCDQGDQGGDKDNCFYFGHNATSTWNFTTFKIDITNNGETDGKVSIPHLGFVDIEIPRGQTKTFDFTSGSHVSSLRLTFSGNFLFDFENFKYLRARYQMKFYSYNQGSANDFSADDSQFVSTTDYNGNPLSTSETGTNCMLYTDYSNMNTRVHKDWWTGDLYCGNNLSGNGRNARIQGLILHGFPYRVFFDGNYDLCGTNTGGKCCGSNRLNHVLTSIPIVLA